MESDGQEMRDISLDVHDREAASDEAARQTAAMRELEALNDDGGDPLAFQDIGHGGGLGAMDAGGDDTVETDSLLSGGGLGDDEDRGERAAPGGLCTLSFYQQFFDVRTEQVRARLLRALDPRAPTFFVEGDSKPDLYGPFWIATTLIFLMAATGNFARYLTSNDPTMKNDFGKVTVAASLLYSVITAVPFLVWLFLRRIGQDKALVEVICLYGYSLAVYVPACLICVVPFEALRWIVTILTCAASSRFLLRNVWNYFTLTDENRQPGYVLLGLMLLVQLGISLMLKIYFFEAIASDTCDNDAGDCDGVA